MTSAFDGTGSRGFCARGEPGTAICLRPGTEIAFRHEPQREEAFWAVAAKLCFGRIGSNLARFRKLNPDQEYAHHDALEFANGKCVYVTDLREGQEALVLQLPAGSVRPPHIPEWACEPDKADA